MSNGGPISVLVPPQTETSTTVINVLAPPPTSSGTIPSQGSVSYSPITQTMWTGNGLTLSAPVMDYTNTPWLPGLPQIEGIWYGNATKSQTSAIGPSAIAIGNNIILSGTYCTAAGNQARAGPSSVAIGALSASSTNSVSLGYSAGNTSQTNYVCIGNSCGIYSNSIAVGSGAGGTHINSVSIGAASIVSGDTSVSIGYSANASAGCVSVGGQSTSSFANNSTVIGKSANSSTSSNSVAIGYSANSTYPRSIVIGNSASSPIAIGDICIGASCQSLPGASFSLTTVPVATASLSANKYLLVNINGVQYKLLLSG